MVTYFCYSCEPLNHQVMRNAQVTMLWFCKTQSLFLYQCSRALWLTDHQNNMEECRVFGVSGYLCLYDQTADRYDDQCKALLWNGRKRSSFFTKRLRSPASYFWLYWWFRFNSEFGKIQRICDLTASQSNVCKRGLVCYCPSFTSLKWMSLCLSELCVEKEDYKQIE